MTEKALAGLKQLAESFLDGPVFSLAVVQSSVSHQLEELLLELFREGPSKDVFLVCHAFWLAAVEVCDFPQQVKDSS